MCYYVFRPQIVLFGDSITEQSFRLGGWGAALADTYSRKAYVVVRGYGGYNTKWALFLLNHLFPMGENKSIFKVKLAKPCYWTTAFRKDGKLSGLVVFYQTGEIEIRSLPDLELVKEYSLMSDLRWNFKANMERMTSSTNNGHIALANGCEVAFVSLLAGENDLRIPDSLPSLHDEVLAAAVKVAISISSDLF